MLGAQIKALKLKPTDSSIRLDLDRAKLRASAEHFQRGRRLGEAFQDEGADSVRIVPFIATASVHQTLAGQGCALPTRQVVHADVYDEFVALMVGIAKQFKVGDPMEPGVLVGPVISAAAVERITGMFDRARADNA